MDRNAKLAAAIEELDNASAAVRTAFDLIRDFHGTGGEYFDRLGDANDGIDWAASVLKGHLPAGYGDEA
jgi:hypothetical protein